jgi:hypothetical protein
LQTLQHNSELLVIRPAATPTSLDDLEPFNSSTVLIDVHKDCYTSINRSQQGGRHRRETQNGVAGHLFRVSRTFEFGAAWKKTSQNGRDYLSVRLDDPSFGRVIRQHREFSYGPEGSRWL